MIGIREGMNMQKKMVVLFLCFVVAIFTCSCTEKKREIKQETSKGEEKSTDKATEVKTLKSETSYYDTGELEREKKYDTKGNITKDISYDLSGQMFYQEWKYEYDSRGNRVSAIYTKDKTVCHYEYKYEYDANGNLKSVIAHIVETDLDVEKYEYDTEGNIVKASCYDMEDGCLDSYGECEYDDTNNMISCDVFHPNLDDESTEGEEYHAKYEYDSEGNLIKEMYTIIEDGNIEVEEEYEFEYEYDNEGNKIKQNSFRDGSEAGWTEYEYY